MYARRFALVSAVTLFGVLLASVPSNATFSGSNGRISFSKFSHNTLQIWTANPDGSDAKQVTDFGSNAGAVISDWSPDGELIAYESNKDVDGRRHSNQIWTMDADGSNQTQLTRGPGFHGFPGWSPDGTRMAIDSDWGDPDLNGIWVIPAFDPGGVTVADATRITDTPRSADFDTEPQYSPDGETIIFTRFKAPHRSAIWQVRTDGSGLDRLTKYKRNASDPDFSPNGKKIVFDSGDVGQPGTKGDIWVMRADGSRERPLTDTPPVGEAEDEFTLSQNPVFSPNGRRIMFTQFNGQLLEIHVMKANGSDRRMLFRTTKFLNKVDWGVHP